jgi:hypothetical protein
VEIIGRKAFEDCELLTEINFPIELKSIEKMAFYGCTWLRSVILPEGLESIASYAFENCKLLCEVYLPKSIGHIGTDVFAGDIRLKRITYGGTLAEWNAVSVMRFVEFRTVLAYNGGEKEIY